VGAGLRHSYSIKKSIGRSILKMNALTRNLLKGKYAFWMRVPWVVCNNIC
jgi:hypothetical protein